MFLIYFGQDLMSPTLSMLLYYLTVLKNLDLANFDPEFFKTHEKDIAQVYESISGKKIILKKQKGLNAVLAFLKK